MNKEELQITKEDLVLWLDRPPCNDDLDLCDYLSNALKNQYKYKEEITNLQHELEQERNIRKEAIKFIKQELSQGGPREIRDLVDGYELLEILNKEVK